ncbi:MAG TPA: ribosomal protein S18-alanine N-acetyltransferase [Levilinea sp.]|nr:ribosomal protein S18-alanine N-acetyltransferase [Levilinea sp.]
MEVTIRSMVLEDIEQVHQIDVLSFSLPWPERSFRFELTENRSSRQWVAEAVNDAGQRCLAAAIVLWVIEDEGHIGTIAVHPGYRRMGIGRRLLAQSLLEIWLEGVRKVFLEVRRGNQPAQQLYRSFGFIEEGVRPRYYRDTGEDALLLRLDPLEADRLRTWL